ncbi:hypothetical protein C1X65_00280 [Pseudomonas sp. FW305-70]|nr:hypothetical protein C1X65_00280 [Pseudomonas sp. FW305-70]
MGRRLCEQQQSIVGAGLLANAVFQMPLMLSDTPSSRASPLPQGQRRISSAFDAGFKTMSATFVLRAVVVLGE